MSFLLFFFAIQSFIQWSGLVQSSDFFDYSMPRTTSEQEIQMMMMEERNPFLGMSLLQYDQDMNKLEEDRANRIKEATCQDQKQGSTINNSMRSFANDELEEFKSENTKIDIRDSKKTKSSNSNWTSFIGKSISIPSIKERNDFPLDSKNSEFVEDPSKTKIILRIKIPKLTRRTSTRTKKRKQLEGFLYENLKAEPHNFNPRINDDPKRKRSKRLVRSKKQAFMHEESSQRLQPLNRHVSMNSSTFNKEKYRQNKQFYSELIKFITKAIPELDTKLSANYAKNRCAVIMNAIDWLKKKHSISRAPWRETNPTELKTFLYKLVLELQGNQADTASSMSFRHKIILEYLWAELALQSTK